MRNRRSLSKNRALTKSQKTSNLSTKQSPTPRHTQWSCISSQNVQTFVGLYCLCVVFFLRAWHWSSLGGVTITPPLYNTSPCIDSDVSVSIKTQELSELVYTVKSSVPLTDSKNIPSDIYNEVSQLCRSLKVSVSLEACVEKIVIALQIKRNEKCLQQRFFVDPSPAPISRLSFRFRRNVARLLAGPFATDIVCELELHSFDTVNNNVAASNATTAYSIVSSFFTYESGLWGPTSLCTTKNSFILVRNLTSAKMMIQSTSATNVFENVKQHGNTIGSETGRLCMSALLIILFLRACKCINIFVTSSGHLSYNAKSAPNINKNVTDNATSTQLAKNPIYCVLAIVITMSHGPCNYIFCNSTDQEPCDYYKICNGTLSVYILFCLSGFLSARSLDRSLKKGLLVTQLRNNVWNRIHIGLKFLMRRTYVLACTSFAFVMTMFLMEVMISGGKERWEKYLSNTTSILGEIAQDENTTSMNISPFLFGTQVSDPSSVKQMWHEPSSTIVDRDGTIVADSGNVLDALLITTLFPIGPFSEWIPNEWWSPARVNVYGIAWTVPALIDSYILLSFLVICGTVIVANGNGITSVNAWPALVCIVTSCMSPSLNSFRTLLWVQFMFGVCLHEMTKNDVINPPKHTVGDKTRMLCLLMIPPAFLALWEKPKIGDGLKTSACLVPFFGTASVALMHFRPLQRCDRSLLSPRWFRVVFLGLTYARVEQLVGGTRTTAGWCQEDGWCMKFTHFDWMARFLIGPIVVGVVTDLLFGVSGI